MNSNHSPSMKRLPHRVAAMRLQTWWRWATLVFAFLLAGFHGAASANQDLVVMRAMPVSSGVTAGKLVYETIYKNGGPGSSDGAQFVERLPAGFVVLSATCSGAFGGAVCPTVTVNNGAGSTGAPLIQGVINTFPEFAVVRVRVEMQLGPYEGTYELSGMIAGTSADLIERTNDVVSAVSVRPLLMDLATSVTSTIATIGGSTAQASNNAGTATINSDSGQVPASVSYRLENRGPDSAVAASFAWSPDVNQGSFAALVAIDWEKTNYGSQVGVDMGPPGAPAFTNVQIVPFECTGIQANAACKAPVLYLVTAYGISRWLDHAPQISANSASASSDFAWVMAASDAPSRSSVDLNPLFGVDLMPGDGVVLKATLQSALYGDTYGVDITTYKPVYQKSDNPLVPTNQLSRGVCTPDAGTFTIGAKVSYENPGTGAPLASVSDNDTSNNEAQVVVSGVRNCPTADVAVSLSLSSAQSPGGTGSVTITPGANNNYTVIYTVKNNGSDLPNGVVLDNHPTSDDFSAPQLVTWINTTRTIRCTSSDPTGSPCPAPAELNQWMNSTGAMVFNSPLKSNASWQIIFEGQGGTIDCSISTSWPSAGRPLNIAAQPVGMVDGTPADNTLQTNAATRRLTFSAGSPCAVGPANQFDIVGTLSPANLLVNVGDRRSLTVRISMQPNGSNNQVARVTNARVRLFNFGSLWATDQTVVPNAYSDIDSLPGPFLKQPGAPVGLPMNYRDPSDPGVVKTNDTGIICTASSGAQCPSFLEDAGMDAAGNYYGLYATIPELPENGYIELTLPWIARDAIAGCAPAPYNQSADYINWMPSLNGDGDARAVAYLKDGTNASAAVLGAVQGSGAYEYTRIPACPTGTVDATMTKTLRDHGNGAFDAPSSTTTYNASVQDGEVQTYDLTYTNTGTLPVQQLVLRDFMRVLCRDGQDSNLSRPPSIARCGIPTLVSLTCSVGSNGNGTAQCPSQASLDAIRSPGPNWRGFSLFSGTVGNSKISAAPLVPVSGSLVFTATVRFDAVTQYTGELQNYGYITGKAIDKSVDVAASTSVKLPYAAGIALTKQVDKLQAGAGELVTYTIDLTNGGNGPLPAGAVFTDPLPENLDSFLSVSCTGTKGPAALPDNGVGVCPAPASIVNDASGITANLPVMLPNTGMRFVITAKAPTGGIITSIANKANVAVPSGSGQANVFASANFAIPSARESLLAAAVAGFKSVRNASGAATVKQGDQLVYTLSYANTSAQDVDSFQISDTLAAGLVYSGGATLSTSGSNVVSSINTAYDGASNTNLLAPGAVLPVGGAITITLPVTVQASVANGTVIENQAAASGTGVSGSVLTDNVDNTNPACPTAAPTPCLPAGVSVPAGSIVQVQTASLDKVRVTVGASTSGLQLSKTVNQASASAGSALSYTITVTNSSTVAATAVQVDDQLPAGVTLVSASDGGVASGGKITWSLDIAPGATRTLTVMATIAADAPASSTLTNSAGVVNPAGFAPVTIANPCAADAARSCAATNVTAVGAPSAVPVPTLSDWALIAMGSLLALVGWMRMRRRLV